MSVENAGSKRTLEVILESGEKVKVRKLTTDDLGELIGHVRHVAPDFTLSQLSEDAEVGDLIIQAAFNIPGILSKLTYCVTGREYETGKWSPVDSLKVLRAALEVNDLAAIVEAYRDFFAKLMGAVERAFASLAGSRG